MRRPVRTITRPPISSRRIRFGEPTSSAPSGVIVAAFRPSPAWRTAAAASCTIAFFVARRDSSERSNRGSRNSSPVTSGASTRSASSSSSCPVSSPSRTTIVFPSIRRLHLPGLGLRPRGYTGDSMARRGGWRRLGSRGRFRYVDSRGRPIRDEAALERIDALRIPPAWRDVRISPRPRAKHRALVRTALVDEELAEAVRTLLAAPGGRRLFRYCSADTGELCGLTGRKLNDYIEEYLGEEFTAKDFRTWGGTLLAAVALAERGVAETEVEAKRNVAAVMRTVGERLGNTAAVARASYISPAVVEQYLDGRTIDDFRPRHLRVVGARDTGLDREERALLGLLRSWRIRRARVAA